VRRAIIFGGLSALSGALFLVFPQIDLAVSALFYRPADGFFLRPNLVVRMIYDAVPVLTWGLGGALVLALGAAMLRRPPMAGLKMRPLVFLLASLLIGPGLLTNTLLKDHWGRARPAQVTEFGGTKTFSPPIIPTDQCDHNCSFVAGHPAMAFYTLSFSFLLSGRRRRAAEIAAVSFGIAVGLVRIMQGGHFLSDVIFAGLVVYSAAWVLHILIMGLHDFPASLMTGSTDKIGER